MDPKKWKKHLKYIRGQPVIYVKCKKAIYGTINAAILAYKKLVGYLAEWEFEQNFYEPCCWNMLNIWCVASRARKRLPVTNSNITFLFKSQQ